MTMLDRMRRHRNWLKWSLALVCLAFVLFYIPDFLRGASGVDLAATDTVAVVNGHEIRADEFRRTYQAQMQAYRGAYGGQMSEQLLKQLGIAVALLAVSVVAIPAMTLGVLLMPVFLTMILAVILPIRVAALLRTVGVAALAV